MIAAPVPVPEKDLPVVLPAIDDFRPDDTGISPLARHEEWYFVPCPTCGKRARRETDVSDTFLDSAWYYLRYPSSEFDDRPFDPARTAKWCPVTTYIGGTSTPCCTCCIRASSRWCSTNSAYLDFEEPFRKFRAHGLIVKDGAKMSKSKGNVVIPDEYIDRWGADSFRMYLMFLGPFQEGGDFRDAGINGIRRFLDKVWHLVGESLAEGNGAAKCSGRCSPSGTAPRRRSPTTSSRSLQHRHRRDDGDAERDPRERPLRARARRGVRGDAGPFAPHFAEECWERLGHATSVFDARWPGYDPAMLVDETAEVAVQVGGKTRGRVTVARNASEAVVVAAASAEPQIAKFLEGKSVQKVIYVPNRLLNLVLG